MIRLISPPTQRVASRHPLRWTTQHQDSRHGLGVVLYARSSRQLDAETFRVLASEGWRIECDDDREMRRVAGALAWNGAPLPNDALRVAETARKRAYTER